MSQTIALGERDFELATAQSIANMALTQLPTSSPKPRSTRKQSVPTDPGGNDEISRAQVAARMRAFMSYKGDEDDLLDDDEWGEGEYDGDGDRLVLEPRGGGGTKRERGTGEEVDEQAEDDEGWDEGNEEYDDRARRPG